MIKLVTLSHGEVVDCGASRKRNCGVLRIQGLVIGSYQSGLFLVDQEQLFLPALGHVKRRRAVSRLDGDLSRHRGSFSTRVSDSPSEKRDNA